MKKVGIMHSGSKKLDGENVKAFTDSLEDNYGGGVDYVGSPLYVKDLKKDLLALANQLLNANVDILVAAGGSRCAEAAIRARGDAKKPIIVFTSATSRVLKGLPPNVTGVNAHSSDRDAKRLEWLLKMPLNGMTIGVLRNSNRHDQTEQKDDIDKAFPATHHPYHQDINGPTTIPVIFDHFQGNIHGLLVAADPFFNNDREQVVNLSKQYPAIYQWRQFVELGGLMSYGPSLPKLYGQAGRMAANILNSATHPPTIPPVWEVPDSDFELVVNEQTARDLHMWPLPENVETKAIKIKSKQ